MGKRYESDNDLNFGQRIALELLWGFCLLMGYSPRWFRFYLLRPFIYCVLRVLRYRRKVIVENLTRSFPEKSKSDIRAIVRGFYMTLAEVVVDTLCLAGATPKRDGDLVNWLNREEVMADVGAGDWIAMASHFGCWEFLPLWSWHDPSSEFITVYHPLRSAVFERFYLRLRSFAPNVHKLPMADAIRGYLRLRSDGRGVILGLVSDQSPNLRPDTVWFDFLNQKTAFVDGAEKLAMRFHLPVYFVYTRRTAPGRYDVRLDKIYDGSEAVEPNEITRRYAEALERMIRETPELWMWSHRRWKHTPEKQAAKFGHLMKNNRN